MLGTVNIGTHQCTCGGDFKVVQTMTQELAKGCSVVVRRKRCKACGAINQTAEIPLDLAKEVLCDD